MSESNVELVRAAWSAFNRGDFEGMFKDADPSFGQEFQWTRLDTGQTTTLLGYGNNEDAGFAEFGAESDQIGPDAEFEALDVDSLDLVELAQIVEDDYGVQLKGEDMEGITTVRQAVDLVMSKLG